ncbi:hypothetical protein RND71_012791 [Anisodus tanguticus]|uniref:Uncharacterized protein n=1 Tax=Anisodus tanguticus TaxID=243964 RepID=A0AAE1SE07_9SOLA|nr:hypothetical protein RND71_012791 [Anisodus tanguticus]
MAPLRAALEKQHSRITFPKLTKPTTATFKKIGFHRGDLVEVASKEDGFLGSYFEAIVVTLPELRPVPPQIMVSEFNLYDKVDAFDNDGRWVGVITGKIGAKYFETFGVECLKSTQH